MSKSVAEAHFERGVVYEQNGNLAQAAEQYAMAIRANDDEITGAAALNLGNVLNQVGDVAGAANAWYTSVQAPPSSATPSAAFNLADLYAAKNDTGLAEALYEMAAKLGSMDLRCRALINRGNMRVTHGDDTAALDDYQHVVKTGPEKYVQAAKIQAAAVHVKRRQSDEAIRLLTEAGAGTSPPEAAFARFNLGNLLDELGDSHGAHAAWVGALDSGVPDIAARAAINLGNVLRDAGDQVGANAAYARAIQLGDPELTSWALNEKRAGLVRSGDYAAAEAAFRRSSELGGSSSPQAALNLGIALRYQGRIADARRQWQSLVDIDDEEVAAAAKRMLSTYRE